MSVVGFAGAALAVVFPGAVLPQAPEKPPELKILERYIGKWKFEMTSRVAEWTPKEIQYSGTSTNEWVLDGRFQQHKVKHDQGVEGIDILTYDPRKKAFRFWSFDSFGISNEMTGVWDEKKQTLTMKGDVAEGITVVAVMQFRDADNREITYVAKDAAGKIYLDIRGKMTRQSK
jgi:hypothetical protein